MANSIEQIEGLFRKADFSKETDLQQRLDKELFAVRRVSLDELMKAEGFNKRTAEREAPARARVTVKSSARQREKDSAAVLEQDNPLIKKGKPPVL